MALLLLGQAVFSEVISSPLSGLEGPAIELGVGPGTAQTGFRLIVTTTLSSDRGVRLIPGVRVYVTQVVDTELPNVVPLRFERSTNERGTAVFALPPGPFQVSANFSGVSASTVISVNEYNSTILVSLIYHQISLVPFQINLWDSNGDSRIDGLESIEVFHPSLKMEGFQRVELVVSGLSTTLVRPPLFNTERFGPITRTFFSPGDRPLDIFVLDESGRATLFLYFSEVSVRTWS